MIVLLGAETAGLVYVSTIVAASSAPLPEARSIAFAAASGLAGIAGLAAFYRGMAVGAIGVVAPISATAAAIPVAFGVLSGERPGLTAVAGMFLAVAGVALASREPRSAGEEGAAGGGRVASGTGLALVAAAGFGSFFVLMAEAVEGGEVFWPMLVNRATAVILLAVVIAVTRPSRRLERRDLGIFLVIGAFDITANGLYALASQQGLVSIVAVLSSLYPVVAVGLAMAVLRERVSWPQRLGAAGAITGAVLLASG